MYNLLKKGNTCNNKVFKEDYMKRNIDLKEVKEKNINDKEKTVQTVATPVSNRVVIVDAGHGTPDERSRKQ